MAHPVPTKWCIDPLYGVCTHRLHACTLGITIVAVTSECLV